MTELYHPIKNVELSLPGSLMPLIVRNRPTGEKLLLFIYALLLFIIVIVNSKSGVIVYHCVFTINPWFLLLMVIKLNDYLCPDSVHNNLFQGGSWCKIKHWNE